MENGEKTEPDKYARPVDKLAKGDSPAAQLKRDRKFKSRRLDEIMSAMPITPTRQKPPKE